MGSYAVLEHLDGMTIREILPENIAKFIRNKNRLAIRCKLKSGRSFRKFSERK